MNQTQTISLYQPLLQAIALKMVGSLEDAEDIVQDTFVKWLTIDQDKINNTKAYLVKTVTNNCINHLKHFQRKKSEYFSNLNPAELLEKFKYTDYPRFDVEKEVADAIAILQKKLEPVERGVYILREVFNFDYEVIQEIFGKKKENCRQLFSRAKEKLNLDTKKTNIDLSQHFRFLDSFKTACTMGHLSEFVQNLTDDMLKNLKST